jgi:hypothetical protein
MTRNALLAILRVVLWDVALCAFPPREERRAIAFCDISRSTRETAQPSGRGEVTRKAQGSLDSARLPPWVVWNKRTFPISDFLYRKT